MPGNRRVKYFHKFIVEYIEIVWASCPGIGRLNIYITGILKYIDVEAAQCLGNRRVKCVHKCIVEYIGIVGASCPGKEN
jgi:hypothetical protein